MEPRPIRIGPSILSADFLRLGEDVAQAESAGADYIHVDVMDGRFVQNISVGLPVVEAVRRASRLPVDVHLMIVEPERWVERFVGMGADSVTIHVETCTHLHGALQVIAAAGATPSVALNPLTPLDSIVEAIPFVRQVLIMSVNPGFGGQTFIPAMLNKIQRLRSLIDERNPMCSLQVDGGINVATIARAVTAGADSIVVGSAVFGSGSSVADAMVNLRSAIADAARTSS